MSQRYLQFLHRPRNLSTIVLCHRQRILSTYRMEIAIAGSFVWMVCCSRIRRVKILDLNAQLIDTDVLDTNNEMRIPFGNWRHYGCLAPTNGPILPYLCGFHYATNKLVHLLPCRISRRILLFVDSANGMEMKICGKLVVNSQFIGWFTLWKFCQTELLILQY